MSSLQAPLWRSIAVFRFASLAYAAVLLGFRPIYYQRWGWAWAVLAAMIAWTVISTMGYAVPVRRTRLLLGADLVLTAAALLSTSVLQWPPALHRGVMPVTTTWLAGPALAWAVAAELEAASRERERLARSIHDSVLQVLAMVQRRGAEAGGEAAEIGRLAGQQEVALRALISGDGGAAVPAGERDLSSVLAVEGSGLVSVITPAEPVLLHEEAVAETSAAVRAAIDNVRQHCGPAAKTWVLVDDEGSTVSITIRDDGPGIRPGRLAEAAAEGRLGVSQSITGRMRDLGGGADIASTPGTGTEVRLRVPRTRVPAENEPATRAAAGRSLAPAAPRPSTPVPSASPPRASA